MNRKHKTFANWWLNHVPPPYDLHLAVSNEQGWKSKKRLYLAKKLAKKLDKKP
jgi:hypothetical protein